MRLDTVRQERGAIAVVFAICAALLFSVAALGVDLGNAFVRRRDAQSQADLAALAGGAALPGSKSATDPAVLAVADYLLRNYPQDDSGVSLPSKSALAAQLVDGNDSNGEVYFPTSTKLRVVTPLATVNFGLANVMGFHNTRVDASATVQILSPGKPLPFMLPENCVTGPVELKDSSSDPTVSSFNPASDNGAGVAKIDSVAPLTVPGLASSMLTIYGKNFSNTLTVDYFQASTGDRVPTDTTASFPATRVADSGGENVATTSLPAGVFNRPGSWYVRISNGTTGYSKSYGTLVVGNPAAPPPGCGVNSTGDFGQLDSPRKDTTQLDDRTGLNIARGLDHLIVPFPNPAYSWPTGSSDTCNGNGGTVPPGAINDTDAYANDANCVDIKTGMNTNADTEGFIAGGTTSNGITYTGLLAADTTPGCDRFGGSSEALRLDVTTNDDVLSCFLPAGISVADVSGSSVSAAAANSISSKIFDSPRFGVVPVIKFGVNPQNGFYPIKTFQPIFITDETGPSTHGTSYATSQNGLVIQSSKLVGVKVVAINPAALPETADYDGPTIPYIGSGTKIVRLVD